MSKFSCTHIQRRGLDSYKTIEKKGRFRIEFMQFIHTESNFLPEIKFFYINFLKNIKSYLIVLNKIIFL